MAPPSDDPVYEAMAQALANVQQPDLSGFPEAHVREATNEMFDRNGLKPEWLDWLRVRIQELSEGMIRLEDADKDDFLFHSKELGAVYQRLVGPFVDPLVIIPFVDQLVIIGNSTPQFLFVPHK